MAPTQTMTVSQIISDPTTEYQYRDILHTRGVGVVYNRTGPRGQETISKPHLFIAPKPALRFLLSRTGWEGQSIEQILRRIPGSKQTRRRLAKTLQYGVQIPMEYLEEHHFDEGESG